MSDTMSLSALSGLPIFPFADEFPYISDEESLELAQDIEANGLAHPLVLVELADPETGEVGPYLLDGRNRLRALGRTNLTQAPIVWFAGDYLDAVDYVATLNLRRRDLSAGQRALIAVAYKPEAAKGAALRLRTNVGGGHVGVENFPQAQSGQSGKARDEAGAKAGVSGRYVDVAEKLMLNAADLAEQVRANTLSLNAAVTEMKKRQADSPGAHAGDKAIADEGTEHPLITAADKVLERLAGLRGELRKADSTGRRAIDKMESFEQVELFAILAKIAEIASADL